MKKLSIIYLLWGVYLAYLLPNRVQLVYAVVPGWHMPVSRLAKQTPYYLSGSLILFLVLGFLLLYRLKDTKGLLLFALHFLLTILSIILYQHPFFLVDLNIVTAIDQVTLTCSSYIIFSVAQLIYLFFLIRMYKKNIAQVS